MAQCNTFPRRLQSKILKGECAMAKKKYSQRPNGLFETTRTINGRRVRFYGRSCAEIDRKILEYNVNAKKGRKLEVIGKEWLKSREKNVAINSYNTYDRYLNVFLDRFGGKRASEVRALDIKRYIEDIGAKGYKRDTVAIHMTVVKQLFSYAVQAGDVDINPAREVSINAKLERGTRRALTEEEEQLVEEYQGEDWLLGVMLLYTGLRRGELLALTWQDIDRKAGTITVNKKINYAVNHHGILEHQLKSANGYKPRPILGVLADLLPKNKIGFIFHGDGGDFLTENEFKKRFEAYRNAVGLPSDITPHCFRHSYATICYDAGISAKETAAFLGNTEEVVRKVYEELRESRRISSAEKVNAFLQMRAEERAAKIAEA